MERRNHAATPRALVSQPKAFFIAWFLLVSLANRTSWKLDLVPIFLGLNNQFETLRLKR